MIKNKRKLRPFQKKVCDLVLQGKNVILQAPTGSGKTQAAMEPFVRNLKTQGMKLPLSCIYATPLRVLSSQFYQEFAALVEHIDKDQGTDYVRRYKQLNKRAVSIQTGDQPYDSQFEALITYCTIDQLLASFLGVPYSVGRSRANINVGAVLGSYLILDEFHLYPLLRENESCFGARTTTLAMLSLLKGTTPFILMTATFSTTLLTQLASLLDAEIVQVTDDELPLIEQGRQRLFEVEDAPMSAEAILSRHTDCSLVICNTVLRAQQCYWELRDIAKERGIEIILLHSRLTDEDRTARSQLVIEALGPEHWQHGHYCGEKSIIVVATQVVEVGLDISVQTLHTEIAPANSLIQRAGRCARFAQQQGVVVVYPLPTESDGRGVSHLPYSKKLCDATRDVLQQRNPREPMDFRAEQALIDAVHTEEDVDLLERLEKRSDVILDAIFTSFQEQSSSVVSTLIRDVSQVQVLIHQQPEDITTAPWRYQSFSLHPGSFAAALKFLEQQRDAFGLEWLYKEAVADTQDQEGEQDSRQMVTYHWVTIPYSDNQQRRERTLQSALMVALPNELATYHPELGFVLRDGRLSLPWPEYQSTPLQEKDGKKSTYKPISQQNYQQHIGGLVQAYNQGIATQIAYTTARLEAQLTMPVGSIDHAIRLAIACHDLGKLSVKWQHWAWEWQRALYKRMPSWPSYEQEETFFFAKTDYDSGNPIQRDLQRALPVKRPNHACESVAISSAFITQCLGITTSESPSLPLRRAICGAIARHHTPQAKTYDTVQLKPGALESIREALNIARQNQAWVYDLAQLRTEPMSGSVLVKKDGSSAHLTIPKRGTQSELETWLYFLIVRALRLADQRADAFSTR